MIKEIRYGGKYKLKVFVITRLPIIDASSRQRVYQFKDILKKDYGIEVNISPFYTTDYFIKYRNGEVKVSSIIKKLFHRIRELFDIKKYDVLWVLRSVAPIEMPWVFKIIKRMGVPIIYEFDDAIYHLDEKATKIRTKLTRNWDKVHRYVKEADKIIVGNETLSEWSKMYNKNVYVIPTGVNVKDYPIKNDFSSPKTFTIGWIGSVSTAPNLEIVIPAILELSNVIKVKLIVIGGLSMAIEADNIEYCNVTWSLEKQQELLKEFDVGIAPLYDTPFNRGKCAYKIIQYMATGIPVIASPVGVQTDIINRYQNGFLADSKKDWVDAFIKLSYSAELQKQMGSRGRVAAEKDYDVTIIAEKLSTILRSI